MIADRRRVGDDLDAFRPRHVADQYVQQEADRVGLRQDRRRVPDVVAERRQNVGLDQIGGGLRGETGRDSSRMTPVTLKMCFSGTRSSPP